MEKIDLTYLTTLGEDASTQLRQLIQNQGKKIVEAINKQLKEADDEEAVVFKLGHAISIDLTEMKIKGKLSFSIKSSTELVTAIEDPEQPEFELGDSGKRGNMGAAGEGDSGFVLGDDDGEDDQPEPAGRSIRHTIEGKPECYCSLCGEIFDNEGLGQAHLDGPMCEEEDQPL